MLKKPMMSRSLPGDWSSLSAAPKSDFFRQEEMAKPFFSTNLLNCEGSTLALSRRELCGLTDS
jgi:hypothetical protein